MNQKTMMPSGHADGCPDYNGRKHSSNSSGGYSDIFCENCHDWFDEPHVLPNGTDIAWPSRWSREQAEEWRVKHGLSRPSGIPAAGPHDRPELTNELSTPGTGMLDKPGSPQQNITPSTG
jgi:hypothetical protein